MTNVEEIRSVDFTKLEQATMAIIFKHATDNPELREELMQLIELIKVERDASSKIRELAYILANKL